MKSLLPQNHLDALHYQRLHRDARPHLQKRPRRRSDGSGQKREGWEWHALQQMRIKLAALIVALSIFSGCTSKQHSMQPDQFVYGSTIAYKGLPDPRHIIGAGDWVIADHLWARLVRLNNDGNETGDLAKGWNRSVNGLSWTFEFPGNLRWSDGSAMTTKDIVASLNLSISGTAHTNLGAYVKKIFVKDATHIVIELKALPQNFLYSLSFTDFAITDGPVKPQVSFDAANPLKTSGPYRIVKASSDQITLEPNLYSLNRPMVDRPAKIVSTSTDEELLALLKKSAVNIAVFDEDALTKEAEKQLHSDNYLEHSSSPEWTVALRVGKKGLKRISKHNQRWLQRQLWERLSHQSGFGTLPATGLRPSFRYGGLHENEWRSLISKSPERPENANLEIELFVMKPFLSTRSYQAVKNTLHELGVTVKEVVYDYSAASDSPTIIRHKNKDYDFCYMLEGVNDPDPDSAWRYMMEYYPGEKKLVSKEELDKALLEPDRKKREAMYKEFEKRNVENPYILPIRMVGSKVFIKPPVLPPEEGQFEWGIQLWKFRMK